MEKNVEISGKARSKADWQQRGEPQRAHVSVKDYLPTIVLVAAVLFFAYDIVADLLHGAEGLFHIVIEMIVFLSISGVLFGELRRVSILRREILEHEIKTARLSGELLEVMHQQFSCWRLSVSENEVALLLVKGLSMREIAEARHVKEKTVRQQATGIYAKSGYAGRHELAAHFIEDLMNDGLKNTSE